MEDRLLNTIEYLKREIREIYVLNRASTRTFDAMLRCAEGWHPGVLRNLRRIHDSMFRRTSRAVEKKLRSNEKRAARDRAFMREMCREMDALVAKVAHVEEQVALSAFPEQRRSRESKEMLALRAQCLRLEAENAQMRLAKRCID